MHRIDTPTAQQGKFGAGKNGFTAGDPTLGVPATQLDEAFFDSVQEEICAVIEGAGIQLKKSDRAQLSAAIDKMIQAKHELALLIKNNLSDVDDVEQARKNLGLGRLALKDSVTAIDVSAIPNGGQLGTTHLNTLTGSKYGRYYQQYTANATAANGYPTNVAGALDVIQNGAGSSEGCTQEYRPYTSNVCYRRYYRGDSKAWSSWEYDLTSAGGVINGFVEITGDARSVTIKPKTANNGYYFFGRKSDNTNHFYLGQGSNNSNNVTWGNYLTNSSISLVAGGVAVSGTITPSNWSNFDARYQAKNTANRASSGWFKDGSTGLIFQWGVARRSGDSTKIAFPIAFPNACLNVQLTLAWAGSFHDQNIYAQLIDRTAFNYIAGSGETMAYFFAVGY
ncbi:gp53-like domain-containing protein [Cronobacter sakazakii]|uniref:gp53-like domain-containing protein n=1 Tax=Cronobacter sakazakii TaxID=28141 RepID=UPI000CFCCE94|nr:phage tail protein [Cronobacter sakazakii]ELZ9930462.1 phage tail protein [Cronobacter malonaticus]PQY01231.1 phage tail protein [Cronobacter sakazakii]PQY71458.1 phage tail protein [Cronobacter sakazakii]PRO53935.1 phage tail protein [Cronobacter sakazakii]PRV94168.1 phage tail protein [Cronobacter sakazakii]